MVGWPLLYMIGMLIAVTGFDAWDLVWYGDVRWYKVASLLLFVASWLALPFVLGVWRIS